MRMTIGTQLQSTQEGIREIYGSRFILRTQGLMDRCVDETHTFLGASLTFRKGNALWKQDLPILDFERPISDSNPLKNPEMPVQSADHAYNLFEEYYAGIIFLRKNSFVNGIKDLEKYFGGLE
jgi:hypothetical protein